MSEENLDIDNQEVEQDIEVTEIALNELEIEEWITKLQLLRESKGQVYLEIDDETELLINYDSEEE
ncbi:MAG: hypothetical protein KJ646_05100 [Nanoarchaeota archaeon]|nr:hypothetical protein [Nanoarchaeota archaeon]MBU4116562.1 hypothetical protein [Nanoarchaeota archaeon]